MKEKEANELVQNLKNFFGAKPIGSYLFYEQDLLKFEDLGDIDILIAPHQRAFLANYLNSLGYSETIKEGKQIGYSKGRGIYEQLPQGDFLVKGSALIIDVQTGTQEVMSLPDIVKTKFQRGTKRDFETIKKVVENSLK